MSIYIGDTEIKDLKIGTVTPKEVYVGDTKVRPSAASYTITGSITVSNFSPSGFSDIQGCYISPDGIRMYIDFWNGGSGRLVQYDLSTPRDVSTATQVRYRSITQPDAIYFSNDGLYFFISSESDHTIRRYTLTTAWDISTAARDQSYSLGNLWAYTISFGNEGKYMVYGRSNNWNPEIRQWELTTPYDLTTMTNGAYISDGYIAYINADGKFLYIAPENGNDVVQYELTTQYDITGTKTEVGRFSVGGSGNDGRALYISPDCKYWTFGIGSTGQSIRIYEAQQM